MKKIFTAVAVTAMMVASGSALASLETVKKNGCLACHSVDKKMVGPAYKDVAAKGMKVDDIVHSIKHGSKGKWGNVPMPPQAKVSDADAKAIAEYINSLK